MSAFLVKFWSINTRKRKILYETVIRPIITYASCGSEETPLGFGVYTHTNDIISTHYFEYTTDT